MNEPETQAEAVVRDALEHSPDEREVFVSKTCGTDESLHQQVRRLLEAHRADAAGEQVPLTPTVEADLLRLKPEEPGDSIGPYKLRELLGQGGFGSVWVADQEQPVHRRVALKIVKLGMDTAEVIARFEQERQALALMDHPSIAKVFDGGATPTGRPYFVMELVHGAKLTDYCDSHRLSLDERLKLFIQVCNAVQHAHQKGIVHRDLKPSNILVTSQSDGALPKVIDFGVAKAMHGRLIDRTVYTQAEQMIGTPLYMSPEQADMTPIDIDTRSDVYSLGVLLYELLTGQTPMDPQVVARIGVDEVRRVIREVDPPRPSVRLRLMDKAALARFAERRSMEPRKLQARLRGDLDLIAMKCLEKDRDRRYATVNGLALDLRRHLGNELIAARPPTTRYLISKLIKRNRAAFAAGTAVAFSLLVGVSVSTWQAIRANQALSALSATAPAFAAQARALAGQTRFGEAIEKLDYAIQLRLGDPEYLLLKADYLQAQFRFNEAAEAYRAAMRLRGADSRAAHNAQLSDRLRNEQKLSGQLSAGSLSELLAVMTREQRTAAEMLGVGRLLDSGSEVELRHWLQRLQSLPVPPQRPLSKRLVTEESGGLALDLSETMVSDLEILKGMPIGTLDLSGCTQIRNLEPLAGMPIHTLFLKGTDITDISALNRIPTLSSLDLEGAKVASIRPLEGLPLKELNLRGSAVTQLDPLRGAPLEKLNLRGVAVTDLSPLAGMPLRELDCAQTPIRDFRVLKGLPLTALNLQSTLITDLSVLAGLPLKELSLRGCIGMQQYEALSELKQLEVLGLPKNVFSLPASDLDAILALRDHPSLSRIGFDDANESESGITLGKESFWKEWQRTLECASTLRKAGSRFQAGHGTGGYFGFVFAELRLPDLNLLKGAKIGYLNLNRTSVVDLSPIAGLPLKELAIDGTRVTSLEPLRGMPLELLFMTNSKVADLEPLRGMALKGVYLEGTQVAELGPLAGMLLNELVAARTAVTDLSPIRGAQLQGVYIAETKVSDLEALRGMPLQVADLRDTLVTNLSPLRGMPLHSLYIQGTPVKDLAPLRGMPLRELLLSSPELSDLSPLADVPTLQSLLLPRGANDLEPLRKLSNLKRLSFDWDNRTGQPRQTSEEFWRDQFSTQWLMNLMQVLPKAKVERLDDGTRRVRLEGQPISDLSALRGAPVSELWVAETKVEDLSPLAEMPIRILDLRDTPVSDLSPLKGLPLKRLFIQRTKVTDLTPLRSLPIETLYLEGVPVTDLNPLAETRALREVILPAGLVDLDALRGHAKLRRVSYYFDTKAGGASLGTQEFWSAHRTIQSIDRANSDPGEKISDLSKALRTAQASSQGEYDLLADMMGQFTKSHLWRGQPKDALPLLRALINVGPPETAPNREEDEAEWWATLASAYVCAKDLPAYLACCREMAERFRNTRRALAAERITKGCSVAEGSGVDRKLIHRLLQTAEPLERTANARWLHAASGLAELRANHLEIGEEFLLKVPEAADPASACANAGLAIIRQKQGRAAEALPHLEKARSLTKSYWPPRQDDHNGFWADWMIANLLVSEAASLMDERTGPR